MKKGRFVTALLGLTLLTFGIVTGCSNQSSASSSDSNKSSDKITVVFYPSESAKVLTTSRDELKKQIHEATGKQVDIQTTTDYNVAIEAISSGKAQLAFMGADGYIQAHARNKKVLPMMIQSGEKGTKEGASYRSYLMVPKDKADEYKKNGEYSIDKVKGSRISFVSATSTSGFAVPTDEIQKHFKLKNKDDLSEGGKFFSKVLYGTSHPGSAVNLLKGDVDVAAFDDIDLEPFMKVSEGSYDKVGSTFVVKDNAEAPFTDFHGKEVVDISVLPVQNGPLVANTATLSEKDRKAVLERFTSSKVSDNPKLLGKEDAKTATLWKKTTDQTKLIAVDDAWYQPTHELIGK
ncbi:phosphate/phosphite/phosphonate ABC transporter substrate-binding protein [Agrilactobacillus yilanensis]|uniref:Phosphate/phosphite/phosphonate ABC transporter substrate-binding protein n=1 Tax=Agrilactobacillus yilanensis TaxID=2485997 RepID=A0ABW4J6A7_9LACO|nr:phosphate/phosphite/phosphonate ABC transporter substrate-binding protein [Agrilactobacillus yilanensis]